MLPCVVQGDIFNILGINTMKLLDRIRALIAGKGHVGSTDDESNISDEESDKDFISDREEEKSNPFKQNGDFFVSESKNLSDHDSEEVEHADYVNEAIEKFIEAKISGSSSEMIENLGQQVVVAMQKEGIEKVNAIQKEAPNNFGLISEVNIRQQKIIEDFKTYNNIELVGNNKDYLDNILARENEQRPRNNSPRSEPIGR